MQSVPNTTDGVRNYLLVETLTGQLIPSWTNRQPSEILALDNWLSIFLFFYFSNTLASNNIPFGVISDDESVLLVEET
jgi:uncharacterized protein YpbB